MKLTPLKEPPEQVIALIEEKLKHIYKERLLLIGARGSIARGKFTPLSDIDLVVIVRDGIDHTREFMYGTTHISVRIVPLSTVLREIRIITIDWPIDAGLILSLRVHYQQGHTYDEITETLTETRRYLEKFVKAIDLHNFTEFYSKAYRAHAAADFEQLQWIAIELVHRFAMIIALINKAYYTSKGPRHFINRIKTFEFQPEGWEEAIRNAMALDGARTMDGIMQMWKIVNLLSLKYKFATKRITSLEDIAFE